MSIILPGNGGNIQIQQPSSDTQLLSQNLAAVYQALLGIQQQLDILIRMEAGGASVRQTWRRTIQEGDNKAQAGQEDPTDQEDDEEVAETLPLFEVVKDVEDDEPEG